MVASAPAACGGGPVATDLCHRIGATGSPSPADNSTTEFRATATDAAGNASACSSPLAYEEVTPAPVPDPFTPLPGPGPDTQAPDTTAATAKAKVKTQKKSVEGELRPRPRPRPAPASCAVSMAPMFAELHRGPRAQAEARHTHPLEALAIDAAGNRDPTPASVAVKVVRKKRR